jgi:uncharacterized membrane protein
MEEEPPFVCSEFDAEENRAHAIVAYVSIFFLIPLFAAPKSKFARYHANQGAILFVFSIPVFMIVNILAHFVFLVPGIGNLLYLLNILVPLICFMGAMAYGIYNSVKGICKPMPFIGKLFTLIKYDDIKTDSGTD